MTPRDLPTATHTVIRAQWGSDLESDLWLTPEGNWVSRVGSIYGPADLAQMDGFEVLATPQFSGYTIDGRQLSWQELAEHRQDEVRRLQKFAVLVSDLDRNEHGRHEGDVDASDVEGVSLGNPHLPPPGATLGYSIHGTREYRMPPRGQRHDPDAWIVRPENVS